MSDQSHDYLHPRWPVLCRYDTAEQDHIAMPVGGIGTGAISLNGRGQLVDFEVRDQPEKGFRPNYSFFMLRTETGDGGVRQQVLESALPLHLAEEAYTRFGTRQEGLPRLARGRFHAAYPFAQVTFDDPGLPVAARVEVLNPLVPGDAPASSWPVFLYRVVLRNPGPEPVRCTLSGSLANFLDEREKCRNTHQIGKNLQSILLQAPELPKDDPGEHGELVLSLAENDDAGNPLKITHRTHWRPHHWNGGLLDYWDDLCADGALSPDPAHTDPIGALAADFDLDPGEERRISFLITWRFPNRRSWNPGPTNGDGDSEDDQRKPGDRCGRPAPLNIGNYYAARWTNAQAIAEDFLEKLPELEERTRVFVDALVACDLPHAVKEAALCNISTLRTQTVFQTPDGRLFGFEGCGDDRGCCPGSCTHVWNYEPATAMLFPDLARTMRDVEFAHATDDTGFMAFRKNLPLDMDDWHTAAADGQMGALIKLYREWQLSGDTAWLRQYWPAARKALEFCWLPGGWDADRDGVMEGCQHNTMDVEYYGPNPQMTGWYLGALRACEEMARAMEEPEFAARCRELFERGSRWMDENLFNGEYYQQEIWPPKDPDAIIEGLRIIGMGSAEVEKPDYQLGAGCLVDQLVGQYLAHLAGLGYLHDPAKVRKTLLTIYEHNFQNPLKDHFNPMRVYCVNGEPGTLMCSYPHGDRPTRPFPYFGEVMTGFEYTAAIGLIQEGEVQKGLEMIQAIRSRFQGHNRNPFDEIECGHHYARAMASWAAIPALTGFVYSAVTGHLRIAAADLAEISAPRWFWSIGSAWGTVGQKANPTEDRRLVELLILEGVLNLQSLELTGFGKVEREGDQPLPAGLHTFHVTRKSPATAG